MVSRSSIRDTSIKDQIPENCRFVEVILGQHFEDELRKNKNLYQKMQNHSIPSSRLFKIFKYKNPTTMRYLLIIKCDHSGCSSSFRKWHNFYNHLRIHTKEKPFKCPYAEELGCNMTFS
jgi:Rieske Fe-S protein